MKKRFKIASTDKKEILFCRWHGDHTGRGEDGSAAQPQAQPCPQGLGQGELPQGRAGSVVCQSFSSAVRQSCPSSSVKTMETKGLISDRLL
jgi:hypothetical protein